MPTIVFAAIFGFQLKHLIADYMLQFDWMVAEKGDIRKFGGYAHAGTHVIGSAIVLLLGSVSLSLISVMLIAEFAVHYALDFGKVHYSKDVTIDRNPQMYFALHGLDQFFHHLTYLVMTYIAFVAAA